MAKDSKIEWTHHTFNPWWGCAKVSPACKHCYAETWAKRVGKELWGAKSPRRFFSDAHWREPLKWNAEALALGEHRRVFCASMADVFEARAELDPWRDRLWRLIEVTPGLDWLLLTKRPHRIASHAPWSAWPAHVWLGTTAENQKWADVRVPELVKPDDKTAAAKQAAEQMAAFIKERGLKTGGSTQPSDMHAIADDPGLAPLIPKSGIADRLLGTLTNPLRKSIFGQSLFFTVKRGLHTP